MNNFNRLPRDIFIWHITNGWVWLNVKSKLFSYFLANLYFCLTCTLLQLSTFLNPFYHLNILLNLFHHLIFHSISFNHLNILLDLFYYVTWGWLCLAISTFYWISSTTSTLIWVCSTTLATCDSFGTSTSPNFRCSLTIINLMVGPNLDILACHSWFLAFPI